MSIRCSCVMILLGSCWVASPTPAQTPRDRAGAPWLQRVLEGFDADRDGRLSPAERNAAREAMMRRRARPIGGANEMRGRRLRFRLPDVGKERPRRPEMLEKWNAGAPPSESAPRSQAMRRAVLQRFDRNGDGTLDEDERNAARDAMAARRRGAGLGPGGKSNRRPIIDPSDLLHSFDADGDGTLHLEERMKALRALQRQRELDA